MRPDPDVNDVASARYVSIGLLCELLMAGV
jgi:hypothetical protein